MKATLLALPLVLSVAACDLEFPHEEVRLRPSAEDDTLDVLLIYRGVSPGDGLEKATAAARRVLEGRREFLLLDWPLYFDLDAERDLDTLSPLERRTLDAVRLVEVGAFLDPDQRLSGYQHLRVSGFRDLLDAAEAELVRRVLAATEGRRSGEQAEFPEFDARTRESWERRLREGPPLFSIDQRGLVLDLPASPEWAAALLAALHAKEREDEDEVFLPNLWRNLREIRQDEERLLLSFGRLEDGCVVLDLSRRDVEYDPSLRTALEEQGVIDLEGAPTLDEVRARLSR